MQARHRRKALHVGAGGDHLATVPEDLDEQILRVTADSQVSRPSPRLEVGGQLGGP